MSHLERLGLPVNGERLNIYKPKDSLTMPFYKMLCISAHFREYVRATCLPGAPRRAFNLANQAV